MGNNTESTTTTTPPTTPTTTSSPISTPSTTTPTPLPTPIPIRAGPGGTPTTGSQACAACKYQRRKCAPDCPLAKHFPANQQKNFLNAHKLFGVSNIVKLLKAVDPSDHEIAVKSLVFHANVRAADPVGGCLRIVRDLERQIAMHEAEMEVVLRQLAVCRAAAAARDFGNFSSPNSNFGGGGGRGGVEGTLGLVAAAQDQEAMLYIDQECYSTMGINVVRENGGGFCGGVKVGVGGVRSSVVMDEPMDVKPLVRLQPIIPPNFRGKVELKEDINSIKQKGKRSEEEVVVKGAVSLISLDTTLED